MTEDQQKHLEDLSKAETAPVPTDSELLGMVKGASSLPSFDLAATIRTDTKLSPTPPPPKPAISTVSGKAIRMGDLIIHPSSSPSSVAPDRDATGIRAKPPGVELVRVPNQPETGPLRAKTGEILQPNTGLLAIQPKPKE